MEEESMGHPWPPTRLLRLLIWTLLGILASIGPGTSIPSRGGPGVALGAERRLPPAPAFTLPDLDGRSRSLADFLGSKPILLEFMSLDCPHCLGMAPVLTRLHAAYGIRLQFLTVALDRDPRRVRKFVEREKHAWSFLMGSQETIDAYKLEGVPTFFLVTPDGRIAGLMVGSASYEAISQVIEAVLRER
jgi:thiol-disulfide isomerase/thioredoxin